MDAEGLEEILKLINIWRREKLPRELATADVVTIFKKGKIELIVWKKPPRFYVF